MHGVVDVGNTDTVLGFFRPGAQEPAQHRRFPTQGSMAVEPVDFAARIRESMADLGCAVGDLSRVVIGSAVPARAESLRAAVESLGQAEVFVLESFDRLPIRVDPADPPLGVGADRIANVVAVASLHERDAIVVDLGTATTYDCVTGDGLFLGGVIAPGPIAGAEWLASRTPTLPAVPFGPPTAILGRRTEDCLRTGIFYSVVDSVQALVSRIKQEWNRPDALVVATGGHAPDIAPYVTSVDEVVPHLTLLGLEIAGDYLSGDWRL